MLYPVHVVMDDGKSGYLDIHQYLALFGCSRNYIGISCRNFSAGLGHLRKGDGPLSNPEVKRLVAEMSGVHRTGR